MSDRDFLIVSVQHKLFFRGSLWIIVCFSISLYIYVFEYSWKSLFQ